MADDSGVVKVLFGAFIGAAVVGLLVVAAIGGIWLGRRSATPAVAPAVATPAPGTPVASVPDGTPPAPAGSAAPAMAAADTPPDLTAQVASLENATAPEAAPTTPGADAGEQPLGDAAAPPGSVAPVAPGPMTPGALPPATVTVPPPPEQVYPVDAQPPEADVNAFAQELQPLGEWVVVPEYQYCWRPRGIPGGWRPYTVGHWVYTDYGWTWDSDERWGTICYHYGSWVFDSRYGWVWVPGRVWAPAWVAWRSGNDCIGWAPLPPRLCTGRRRIVAVDVRGLPAASFCFVSAGLVLDVHLDQRVRPVRENVTIIKQTVNITNINVTNKVVVNASLNVQHVEQVTNKKVERVAVQHVADATAAEAARKQGHPVLYVPHPVPPRPAVGGNVKNTSGTQGATSTVVTPAVHPSGTIPPVKPVTPPVRPADTRTPVRPVTPPVLPADTKPPVKPATPPVRPADTITPVKPVTPPDLIKQQQAAEAERKHQQELADQAARQKATEAAALAAKQKAAEEAAKQKAIDEAAKQNAAADAAKQKATEAAALAAKQKAAEDAAKQKAAEAAAKAADQAKQDAADRARQAQEAAAAAERARQAQDAADRAQKAANNNKSDPGSTSQPAPGKTR